MPAILARPFDATKQKGGTPYYRLIAKAMLLVAIGFWVIRAYPIHVGEFSP